MPAKIWQLMPKTEAAGKSNSNLPPVLAQLLHNRGLDSETDIRAFLSGRLEPDSVRVIGGQFGRELYDPFLFQDMEKAVEMVINHIRAGNKILVYGDYDADGVTASVVLLEVLRTLRASAEIYLPDRVSEGYGLNRPAIAQAVEQGFKLIITVDNGIRNREEVEYAKSLGLDVIITDHHVFPEDRSDWPDCPVINPAHPEDRYPWKYLAGVGVAFKLASALADRSKLEDVQKAALLERALDLVALGTVADMVNILGENRALVKAGLEAINRRRRLGLNELIRISKLSDDQALEAWNIGWQLGPRLNAASRLGHANTAFSLLTAKDKAEAEKLAQDLDRSNRQRQEITEAITAQVEAQIDTDKLPPIIIGLAESGQNWNEGVIGLVAGRIAERYYRPTLIIARIAEEGAFVFKGSGRSIEGFNLIEAISEASRYLDKYGGHFMACGFSLSGRENLDGFRQELERIAAERLDEVALTPKLKLEAELPLSEVSLELIEKISELGPFGQNNPVPVLASFDLPVLDIMVMGAENQHIKFRLGSSGNRTIWAVAFGGSARYQSLRSGDRIDIAYTLSINGFNGRREPQLKVVDIRLANKEKL